MIPITPATRRRQESAAKLSWHSDIHLCKAVGQCPESKYAGGPDSIRGSESFHMVREATKRDPELVKLRDAPHTLISGLRWG